MKLSEMIAFHTCASLSSCISLVGITYASSRFKVPHSMTLNSLNCCNISLRTDSSADLAGQIVAFHGVHNLTRLLPGHAALVMPNYFFWACEQKLIALQVLCCHEHSRWWQE